MGGLSLPPFWFTVLSINYIFTEHRTLPTFFRERFRSNGTLNINVEVVYGLFKSLTGTLSVYNGGPPSSLDTTLVAPVCKSLS